MNLKTLQTKRINIKALLWMYVNDFERA